MDSRASQLTELKWAPTLRRNVLNKQRAKCCNWSKMLKSNNKSNLKISTKVIDRPAFEWAACSIMLSPLPSRIKYHMKFKWITMKFRSKVGELKGDRMCICCCTVAFHICNFVHVSSPLWHPINLLLQRLQPELNFLLLLSMLGIRCWPETLCYYCCW